MAYQTYITEALVCGSRSTHTSDRAFLLFTREAGMVYATAKSVREERSKQRYALQEFSHVRATLVHGKSGWRVAGVEPVRNLYSESPSRESRTLLRNLVLLLRRVMQGETPYEAVFDHCIAYLNRSTPENADDTRSVLSLYILSELGYVSPTAPLSCLIENVSAGIPVRALTDVERKGCEVLIEHALKESQL